MDDAGVVLFDVKQLLQGSVGLSSRPVDAPAAYTPITPFVLSACAYQAIYGRSLSPG